MTLKSQAPMPSLLCQCLCLSLLLPLSISQSTNKELGMHSAPAAPPPAPPPHIQDILKRKKTTQVNSQETYSEGEKVNDKIGVFIAASVGTLTLMAVMYCIYNRFYTKHQYLHTQLAHDPDDASDPMDSPVYFHATTECGPMHLRKPAYGSLSASASTISIPPSLSPPPSAMPFPPVFLSSQSLRTISAKDLEKGCI